MGLHAREFFGPNWDIYRKIFGGFLIIAEALPCLVSTKCSGNYCMANFHDYFYVRGDEICVGINIFLLCGRFGVCGFGGHSANGVIWHGGIISWNCACDNYGDNVVLFTTDYAVANNTLGLCEDVRLLTKARKIF